MQSSLIQCVFTIPIDVNVVAFLSSVNGTHFNISDIANSQILMFLDILKDSNNGEFVTLQVVIGYVANAESNTFHTHKKNLWFKYSGVQMSKTLKNHFLVSQLGHMQQTWVLYLIHYLWLDWNHFVI